MAFCTAEFRRKKRFDQFPGERVSDYDPPQRKLLEFLQPFIFNTASLVPPGSH
jgi:hypothetical protein